MKREELTIEDKNRRRALGRGLGSMQMHQNLGTSSRRARVLREEPLPPGMPGWARGFFRKVCRLGRRA